MKKRGITLCIHSNKLVVTGNKSILNSLDLKPIQHNKAYLINALPHGVHMSPSLIVKAIQDYSERVDRLMQQNRISRLDAENRAFYAIRDFIGSSL